MLTNVPAFRSASFFFSPLSSSQYGNAIMPLSAVPRRKFIPIPDFIRSFLLRFQELSSNATMSQGRKRPSDRSSRINCKRRDSRIIGAPFERFLERRMMRQSARWMVV